MEPYETDPQQMPPHASSPYATPQGQPSPSMMPPSGGVGDAGQVFDQGAGSKKKLFLAIGLLLIIGIGASIFMLMSGSDSSSGVPHSADAALDMPPPSAAPADPMLAVTPGEPAGDMVGEQLPPPAAEGGAPTATPDAPMAAPAPAPVTPVAPASDANAQHVQMCSDKFNNEIRSRGQNPDDHVVARDNYVKGCVDFLSKQVPQQPAPAAAPAPLQPATPAP